MANKADVWQPSQPPASALSALAQAQPELNLTQISEAHDRTYVASDMWNKHSGLPCLKLALPPPLADAVDVAMPSGRLDLPPLQELLPAIDNYFNNYNRHLPLFDQLAFMRMVLEWHSSPANQSIIPWAAINVVLAISYRVLDNTSMHDVKFIRCLSNVRSATADLMAWNKDLLGVQTLLAMVILFQSTPDPQFPIVLSGSAMRLIQSMGLPSQRNLTGVPSSEALHRHRLFWIAYIFDRVCLIAMISSHPYLGCYI